jgi:NDP-sugar pyrophosphorylase family protein
MFFNIVISLAGKSKRFFDEGFTKPKYYLPMADSKTMIEHSIDSLNISGNLILIVQREHCEKYQIDTFLKEKYPNATVCYLDSYTEGAAESVYLATKDLIDNDTPLVITNCDQTLEWDSSDFVKKTLEDSVDGCVLTYSSDLQKNSYAMTEEGSTKIVRLAEKEVISHHSLVGVHSWKKGSDFVKYAEQMIEKNIRVNNEFYVCPVFNQAIEDNKKIRIYEIKNMWGLGTPEDLKNFLNKK